MKQESPTSSRQTKWRERSTMDADIEVGSAYLTKADHKLTTREKEFLTHLTDEQDNYRKEPL
jgi:hypothetical protein